MRIICVLSLILAFLTSAAGREVNVIPKPTECVAGKGEFTLSEDVRILYPTEALDNVAGFLADDIYAISSLRLDIVKSAPARAKSVKLLISDALEIEEYAIDVKKNGIEVIGGSAAGVFYGTQTLLQLIEGDKIPVVRIKDKPCFSYRGTHLDVARHFFTVDEVKKFIDIIAKHKVNRFHWHLTDDQGWRIEIKKYPLLTEIGSIRKQTLVGKHSADNNSFDGKPHGGFYTQDEIRDIVAYASDRFIEVIPEIDLPGHMQAALAAYPELGCTGGPYEMRCRWGISDDVLCAGNDKVYEFLKDVMSEVLELFPSEYIHIGGDECPKVRWKACPKCQAKIAELGLKDKGSYAAEHFLQNHVMSYIEKYLNDNGRRMIGWDEILEGSASETSTVMVWRDVQHGITAIRRGNDIILTPRHYCYLDYCQTSEPESEPLCVTHRYLSMRQVYRLEPFDRVMLHERNKVLGVQCNVWTEYISDFKQVQHMLLPRLAAHSEIAWSYDRMDVYEVFAERARKLLPDFYSSFGMVYAPYFFEGIE